MAAMMKEPAQSDRPSDGTDVEITVDGWGRIVLTTSDSGRHVGVDPIRAFPISHPDGFVSFCDLDGREVLCLETIDGLDPESRRVLDEELARREFVPVIRRIVRVSAESTPADWDVVTDRGETRFTLDSEDDIRPLGPDRLLITDSRKIRYQVVDRDALDAQSRRLLDRFQ